MFSINRQGGALRTEHEVCRLADAAKAVVGVGSCLLLL